MPLNTQEKQQTIAEIREFVDNSLSLVIANARGTTAGELTQLRKQARENQVVIKVIKNTLAKRAFENTDYACTKDVLTGPSLFGFSMESPGAAARLFKDFAKNAKAFEVKALSIGGELLDSTQINRIASLPTKEQALSILANVTLAPVTKMARTLNEIPSQMVHVLDQIKQQKQL